MALSLVVAVLSVLDSFSARLYPFSTKPSLGNRYHLQPMQPLNKEKSRNLDVSCPCL